MATTNDGRNDSIAVRCRYHEDSAVMVNGDNLFTGPISTCLSGSATTPNLEISAFKPDTTGEFHLIDIAWNSTLKSIHAKALAEKAINHNQDHQVWNVEAHLMLAVKNVLYVGQKLSDDFNGRFDIVKPFKPHLLRFYIPPSASAQEVIAILRDNLIPKGPMSSDLKFDDSDIADLANIFETHMRDGGGDNSTVFLAYFVVSYVFLVKESGRSRYGRQKNMSKEKITDLSVLRFINTRTKITTCAICLEDLENGRNEAATTCYHRFHYLCLITWLQRKNECPVCRTKFSKECLNMIFR